MSHHVAPRVIQMNAVLHKGSPMLALLHEKNVLFSLADGLPQPINDELAELGTNLDAQ